MVPLILGNYQKITEARRGCEGRGMPWLFRVHFFEAELELALETEAASVSNSHSRIYSK